MSVEENSEQQRLVVSVIIPAYKRSDLVRKALLSLFNQEFDKEQYEIIVVDSSPDDQTVSLIAELQASAPCALRCCHLTEREDAGPSRNLGVRHGRGEFFAFMDSDCQATPEWLREGIGAFEDGVGLVQGRTDPDPAAFLGVFTRYVKVEQEGFIYECANIFYRRKAFEETGGFTTYGFDATSTSTMGGEDLDLAWRVKRNGWKTRFAPGALVYHEVIPISVWRWLFEKRLYIWPCLTKKFPELRQFFFARYFYNGPQAFFVAAMVGLALGNFTSFGFALCAPYLLLRASERTRTLKGILRPLRVVVYLPKDALTFLLLVAGSLRYRSLLL